MLILTYTLYWRGYGARGRVPELARHAAPVRGAHARVLRADTDVGAPPAERVQRAPVVALAERAAVAWRAVARSDAAYAAAAARQPCRPRVAREHHGAVSARIALVALANEAALAVLDAFSLARALAQPIRRAAERCVGRWRHHDQHHGEPPHPLLHCHERQFHSRPSCGSLSDLLGGPESVPCSV